MQKTSPDRMNCQGLFDTGADDEARTRYLHLGKVALYQMSYVRGTVAIISNPKTNVKGFFQFFEKKFKNSF